MILPWIPFVLLVFQCINVFNWFLQMYPIIGDRYRCVDCTEIIGFDLCGDCYKNRSKRPGRFNQKHTPDHKLELVQYQRMLISRGQDSSDLIVIQDETDSSTDGEQNQSDSDATNWKIEITKSHYLLVVLIRDIMVNYMLIEDKIQCFIFQSTCESSNPHGLSGLPDLCILVFIFYHNDLFIGCSNL
jgi:hypothetical protein